MIRIVRGLLVLAVAFLFAPAQAQEMLRIAAVVNDEVISGYDLNSRLTLALVSSGAEDRPETRRRLAPQVLRGLIDEKLKLQEAQRLDIRVTKENIDHALAQVERQNGLSKGGLDDFLTRFGIEKPVLIDQLEAEIAWVKVVSRRLRANIQIGDDEIDDRIARIEANKGKPEHRVGEIFLPVENPRQESEIRALAERLYQQLKGGAGFSALAQNFSQSASAAVGGDLGWISPGQLGGEFDAMLAKMKPGQFSPPVKSLNGYHILLLRDRRTGRGLSTKDQIVTLQQLFVALPANPTTAEVSSQMELAATMGQVAKNCEEMKALGRESGSPMSGSLGKVRLSRLPYDLRSVVETLPLDTASQPQRGGNGIIVLMVCEREEGSPDTEVRERIKEMLVQQRLDIAARSYLRDLRRAAFIDVRL